MSWLALRANHDWPQSCGVKAELKSFGSAGINALAKTIEPNSTNVSHISLIVFTSTIVGGARYRLSESWGLYPANTGTNATTFPPIIALLVIKWDHGSYSTSSGIACPPHSRRDAITSIGM